MSVYTDQDRVEGYLQRSLNASELVNFDDVIEYVSGFINDYTNREWNDLDDSDPAATARLFDGNGEKELEVDTYSDLSQVEILDSQGSALVTLTDEDDWVTYPHNSTYKDSVYLRNYIFPKGVARIRLTAVWGSGDVPAAVIMVTTALVGKFIASSPVTSGGFKKESIEGYSYELKTANDLDTETSELLSRLDYVKKISL
jgi:hypothetical protein